MSPKRVLVVGAGKRVLETALPALAAAADQWELAGVFARSEREEQAAGSTQRVRALDSLSAEEVGSCDLIYVAVGKPAVPKVLRRLLELGAGNVELLLDTPVLLPKHYRFLPLIDAFRHASIAEDVFYLPCWDPLDKFALDGSLGAVKSAFFDHSQYAYHGVCAVQRVLRARVKAARRESLGGEHYLRRYAIAGGRTAWVLDPRDYSRGGFLLVHEGGCVSDSPLRAPDNHVLEAMVEDERCVGFRVGDAAERLEEPECALLEGDPSDSRLFQRMQAMKRVGFYRILQARHEGTDEGYGVTSGMQDALVDYALEKLGRWRSTPLTSAHAGATRLWLRALSRLAGK